MPRKRSKATDEASPERAEVVGAGEPVPSLVWLKAAYAFHSFAYRDPRSAFSSGAGLPLVSPTTVLLGIGSTLFSLGEADEARAFLGTAHLCKVVVDPPRGAIFFRAFHQLRRYYSSTKGRAERVGFTNISQGTREYGLPDGSMIIYVGVPKPHVDSTRLALKNRDHLGTHDSLCSLVGEVEPCDEPKDVVYCALEGSFPTPKDGPVTVVTLSRFRCAVQPTVGKHWWMAGGDDTELVPYLIKGRFYGTSRGKIYRKF
jgi:hypothetical protein